MHRFLALGAATMVALTLTLSFAVVAHAQDRQRWGAIFVQCPGDVDGDSVPDPFLDPPFNTKPNPAYRSNVHCLHLAAGDGMVTMADGKPLYTFGFSNVTGVKPADIMRAGELAANFPAPTIRLKQGEEFYLNLTNVGMVLRPDLFDAHSVHFHGFPQAASVFDGVPESSTPVRMGSTFTYYYNIVEPGTYMYHCHVEATEHMQMGMLGNLYVEPRQNGTEYTFEGRKFTKFAYNDGDGSTGYDVDYPVQMGSFDPNFHDQHLNVQPLPFAAMTDKYPMLNGRGYPDTVNPAVMSTDTDLGPRPSQPVHSLISAKAGERILLRISNLAVTRLYTLASTLPMQVVGQSARLLRGPGANGVPGKNLYYRTNSVTLGGGESADVIVDTKGLTPGKYAIYTTNLKFLSNDKQDFGGMMTEIHIQ